MKATSWLTLVGLVAVIGVVVYSSLEVGRVQCDICVSFQGRESCRTVEGDDEQETRTAGITNACALISSGVTDSMACARTTPTKANCRPR